MIDSYSRWLTVAAAVGAGLYLAFSTFVMPGLRKLPPAHAISAMSSINKAAPSNPLLILVGYHVPHNDQLMKVGPNAAGAGATWSRFYTP